MVCPVTGMTGFHFINVISLPQIFPYLRHPVSAPSTSYTHLIRHHSFKSCTCSRARADGNIMYAVHRATSRHSPVITTHRSSSAGSSVCVSWTSLTLPAVGDRPTTVIPLPPSLPAPLLRTTQRRLQAPLQPFGSPPLSNPLTSPSLLSLHLNRRHFI